jgi:hypothetical protein
VYLLAFMLIHNYGLDHLAFWHHNLTWRCNRSREFLNAMTIYDYKDMGLQHLNCLLYWSMNNQRKHQQWFFSHTVRDWNSNEFWIWHHSSSFCASSFVQSSQNGGSRHWGMDFVSYSWKVSIAQAEQDIQLVLKLYSLFCIL